MPRYWGRLTRLDEALEKGVKEVKLQVEVIREPVWRVCGLINAEDIYAPMDLPPYNNSAVDGYAVRAEDTYGVSPTNPIRLRVKGLLKAGDPPDLYGRIDYGEAIEVYTGAPLPPGANAVVMYEDTRRIGNEIEVFHPVPMYANVNRAGDDVRRDELVLGGGIQINPYHIAMLVSLGIREVSVYRPLRIGILSIGDELIDLDRDLGPGKRYSSTDVLVEKYLEEIGFVEPRRYGIVPDDLDELATVLDKMLSRSDIVVTVGGTSVSEKDLVPEYVERHGRWVVHGIALRPGRTNGLAVINGKPLFALSGNPVAAWVGLEALVKPLLYRWLGSYPPLDPYVLAVLRNRVVNQVGYRSYVRVSLEFSSGKLYAVPYMVKGSSIVSSLARTHGYIVVPEDHEGYEAGETVKVYLLSRYTML